MLTLNAPADLVGDLLKQQLAAAGLVTQVVLNGGKVELFNLDESQRTAAQAVLDSHGATARAETTRVQTEATNAVSIRDSAAQALAANKTFLAIASPTNAQVSAQVKALTRQNQGLIRLVLQRFDGTD